MLTVSRNIILNQYACHCATVNGANGIIGIIPETGNNREPGKTSTLFDTTYSTFQNFE